MNIIQELEGELGKPEDSLPRLNVGDDIEVDYLIREGDKERIQTFKGLVLAIQGRGLRKRSSPHVQGEGVEQPSIHSPRVQDIRVTKGKVRRSKLYYMRDRVGKATRTKGLGEKVRPNARPRRPAAQHGPRPPSAEASSEDSAE